MKIRNGFVSNSSSSSFVVALSMLSEDEKQKILDYVPFSNEETEDYRDHWSIRVDEKRDVMYGFTIMDNGDLSKYLGEELNSKFVFEGE